MCAKGPNCPVGGGGGVPSTGGIYLEMQCTLLLCGVIPVGSKEHAYLVISGMALGPPQPTRHKQSIRTKRVCTACTTPNMTAKAPTAVS